MLKSVGCSAIHPVKGLMNSLPIVALQSLWKTQHLILSNASKFINEHRTPFSDWRGHDNRGIFFYLQFIHYKLTHGTGAHQRGRNAPENPWGFQT